MKNVIRDKYNRDPVYLVAYNNFRYDQNILENNFKVCNIKMPLNWFFIDIFPIIKEMFPNMKPNYKLKTIYENLFWKGVKHVFSPKVVTKYDLCKYVNEIYNLNINIVPVNDIIRKDMTLSTNDQGGREGDIIMANIQQIYDQINIQKGF
jgi:hypothetical protein